MPRLYYRNGFEGKEELLYDPKSFKPDSGNEYIINYINPSWDASKIVVSLTANGAEISEMVIVDVKTREVLPDVIGHAWPSDGGGVSWLPDNSGFIYLHYPEIDNTSENFLLNMKAALYKIGQDPIKIKDIFSAANNPELGIQPEDFPIVNLLGQNDQYLIGYVSGATPFCDTYYAEIDQLSKGKIEWKLLFTAEDKVGKILFDGHSAIYLSAKGASNFQLCKTSLKKPDFNNPQILVKEKKDEVIKDFTLTKEGLFFTTTKNGVEANLYSLVNGKEKQVILPQKSGNIELRAKGREYSDVWVTTNGWISDFRRYRYDIKKKSFEVADLAPLPLYNEFEDFVVEEVLVASHDGVEVPLSLVYKKSMKKNGANPTLIYGYGSYGVSLTPWFLPDYLSWVMEGGVLAFAHVRGGGEKGDGWHNGGLKTTKPNTWKDMIACTEYLIKEGYTSNKHTAILGVSAGGILIGRAMTERPDLFAAAIPKVGVLNPLRMEFGPNGPNSAKEFGSSKDLAEFKALVEMDAYLNIREGTEYPATLITAGIKDPRVIAWQPAKFAARLQQANVSQKPILFLVDYESGHGMDDSKLKGYEQMADALAFALWQTGHPKYQLQLETN